MTLDFVLSVAHFWLVFAIVGALTAQAVLIKPGMTSFDLRLAARLDRIYGACAVVLLAAGFGRVYLGAKGAQFYMANPTFWTKITLFLAVGLLSIAPTVRLIRWHREARRQVGYLPPTHEVLSTRRWLFAEVGILALIPIAAAAMARGHGFG